MTSSERDAGERPRDRVLRRAVAAGGGVWLVLSLVLGVALAPGGGRAVFAGVSWALTAGLFVAAGWSCVALALDLLRGDAPARDRLAWTVVLGIAAIVMPLFAAAATSVS